MLYSFCFAVLAFCALVMSIGCVLCIAKTEYLFERLIFGFLFVFGLATVYLCCEVALCLAIAS